MRFLTLLFSLILAAPAFGAATRSIDADTIRSSDHTKAWTTPNQTSGQLVSTGSIDTLTNKTISGANNTLSQLPIAVQTVQDNFVGNGSTTIVNLTQSNGTPAADDMKCYLDGLILTRGTDFTYTATSGTVTFTSAPATGQKIKCVYSSY